MGLKVKNYVSYRVRSFGIARNRIYDSRKKLVEAQLEDVASLTCTAAHLPCPHSNL